MGWFRYPCRLWIWMSCDNDDISREQYKLACEKVQSAGLGGRVTVLFQDYRELKGTYDKLVSIEMIEAVGADYVDEYFQVCSSLLKEDGMMLLQAITIDDRLFDSARKSVDFIQRYIFPGSNIPSVDSISSALKRQTDMRLFHLDDIGSHYARTLLDWRARFFANRMLVKAMGFSDEFVRMWDYYLCYCAGGFQERCLGTVQMLLTKPRCQREPILKV